MDTLAGLLLILQLPALFVGVVLWGRYRMATRGPEGFDVGAEAYQRLEDYYESEEPNHRDTFSQHATFNLHYAVAKLGTGVYYRAIPFAIGAVVLIISVYLAYCGIKLVF